MRWDWDYTCLKIRSAVGHTDSSTWKHWDAPAGRQSAYKGAECDCRERTGRLSDVNTGHGESGSNFLKFQSGSSLVSGLSYLKKNNLKVYLSNVRELCCEKEKSFGFQWGNDSNVQFTKIVFFEANFIPESETFKLLDGLALVLWLPLAPSPGQHVSLYYPNTLSMAASAMCDFQKVHSGHKTGQRHLPADACTFHLIVY